ncbi:MULTISPECIES: DNA polymerase III subunit beta [unclassified Chelatococcus]|uniref:DNA polymerase III subunit beta n=1 Tax=unclassified Chelatococcus TaxID=2638111 RepID=UPI001BD06356|nr:MULTISPECIES: DNA polymerase III subunit beta [unclassified Chelatococcus]MBS7699197.1 DNA polymerase III subunit beta [Chelatococcus sp. YT9]MBX3554978.1 DNA polymerase III subunit beta [Chelatococcus sp.]
MKLTLDRAALLKPLAALNRIVEKRTTIPILSNILLKAADGRLTLQATDLDMEATAGVAAEVEAPGAITLPSGTLHDIARKMPEGGRISMEANAGGTHVLVKSGRSRFTVNALPPEDFPDLSAGDRPHSFIMPAKTLARLIEQTRFAISTEETRYYLNGIFLHVAEGREGPWLTAVATDGHRLARARTMPPDGAIGMPGVIVPRKTVGELVRMLDTTGDVAVSLSSSKIRFAIGDEVLTSKLIDGTFPDYLRVIPQGNDKRATLDRVAMAEATDRVSTVSSDRGRAVKFAFEQGRVSMSVTNPESGEAHEEMEADYEAEPISIGFNAKYMAEILSILDSDKVAVTMADPGSPTLIVTPDDDSLLLVLMPMRV